MSIGDVFIKLAEDLYVQAQLQQGGTRPLLQPTVADRRRRKLGLGTRSQLSGFLSPKTLQYVSSLKGPRLLSFGSFLRCSTPPLSADCQHGMAMIGKRYPILHNRSIGSRYWLKP